MENMMGVINIDREHDFLNELTYFRCGAAVPFLGRYRLIDFVLSNMASAGMFEIALFVRNKYRSLFDHLGEGKEWNLDRKVGGLFILPPDWHDPTDFSVGDLRHFHNNIDFFHRGLADYVLHAGSQHICNIDYSKVLDQHIAEDADVTLIYKNIDQIEEEHGYCKRLEVDDQGRVSDIYNAPENNNVYMEMFIINKDLMLELVNYCIAHRKDYFFGDAIMDRIDELDVYSYEYKGFHGVVNSIKSYYKNSMRLLEKENYKSLFHDDTLILTKVKDEVPTKYYDCSRVKNSLVANGCMIKGEVKNSIIFRQVEIDKGVEINNSIIMQRGKINKNAVLSNVILDKEVTVEEDTTLVGGKEQPFVAAKRASI
ncbi:MAG: glucose-1-phosphate adenylyltransferase subunit GlgD [Bacillota bacterium]